MSNYEIKERSELIKDRTERLLKSEGLELYRLPQKPCGVCGVKHSGVSSCDAANTCHTCQGDCKVVPFFSIKEYISDVEANVCGACDGSGETLRYRLWQIEHDENGNIKTHDIEYDIDNPEVPIDGICDKCEIMRLSDIVVMRNCRIQELEMKMNQINQTVIIKERL